jgi:CRP-like cAMP-binding protein
MSEASASTRAVDIAQRVEAFVRVRLEALGLGERSSYKFPMTQDQLADVTGLTPVHVNRSLKALEGEGLLTRSARYVAVADWANLQKAGDFHEAYLHLETSKD